MNGIIKEKRRTGIRVMTVAAIAAAVFALLYYAGVFLPGSALWHDAVISGETEDEPDEIVLKNRSVSAFKDGERIFETPLLCRVQNAIFTDIDRDGMKELILLNFNIGRYGDHRPFWVRFDPPVFRQHIYIYDYEPARKIFRPIWMASDIGMEASDMEMEDKQVIRLTDSHGVQTRWMWISFGLRCVD